MVSRSKSLQAILSDRLEKYPEHRAISFYDIEGNYRWLTFAEFTSEASRYAWRMAELGVGKGDVCVLILHSTEYSVRLLYATLLIGAIPLLIAPPALHSGGAFSQLTQVINHVIKKTRPRLVVCSDTMIGLKESYAEIPGKTRLVFESDLSPADVGASIGKIDASPTDVGAMQLTSGTTGLPKVCVWSQQSVIAALDGMAKAMDVSKDDIYLNWTPLYHDMGLVNNFFLCMAKNIPMVMMTPIDFVKKPAIWLRSLHDTKATITWSPNFGFAITTQRAKESELEGVRLDLVRGFYNAAERIHHETYVSFYERFASYGIRKEALKTNFGCAENIGGATFSAVNGQYLVEKVERRAFLNKRVAIPIREDSSTSQEAMTIVGVGRPHPDMSIQIFNRFGKPLPDGHVGEIGLKTPSRMEGYLKDARATRKALFKDFLLTGDMGYTRGGEVFWVGRTKERITIRGVKLDPSDFEPILLRIPDLRSGSFVAFGVDDPELGTQQIVIVTEVRDRASRPLQEISGQIRQEVFDYLGINVSEVMLVKQGTLTKTSSGKRRHKHFRDLYQTGKLKEFELTPESNLAPSGD